MALRLEKAHKGIAANYWKLTEIRENRVSGFTSARLSLYVNEAARTADINNSLEHVDMSFEGLDKTAADVYALVKQPVLDEEENNTNEFSVAVDC